MVKEMKKSTKIGIKAVRIADSAVNTAVLIAILFLLVIGGYALWDSHLVTEAASSKNYEEYKPGEKPEEGLSFEELQAINPDVLAWLTVYGTHIDYPVTQGEDNLTYVNTDAEGNYSLSGSIFLDSASSPDFSDFSSILYGHHMEKEAMFGEIGLFAESGYFDARQYGSLYYGGEWHGLEFFAFFRADAYDNNVFRAKIKDPGEQQAYLDMILGLSSQTRDIPVGINDRILLLSTCSPDSTNERFLLVGKITDNVTPDPFAVSGEGDGETRSTDGLTTPSGTNWLGLIIMLAIIVLIAILAILLNHRSRRDKGSRSKKGNNHEHQ